MLNHKTPRTDHMLFSAFVMKALSCTNEKFFTPKIKN